MIIAVDQSNLFQAATVHSISWREAHRSFCTPAFIERHTPERQQEYLSGKIREGSKIYMLVEEWPMGIVSVSDSLIEDLYVLPEKQNMGYGTRLLLYAIEKCTGTPTLWILKNNTRAERLYLRIGFRATGRIHVIPDGLNEIEYALTEKGDLP